jgi:hypothetical protein
MSDDAEIQRISASGTIAAPATDIFRVVANPQGHVAIDGSGMLQVAPDTTPFTHVGQTFTMHMDREPLGDRPMGKYTVHNVVTQLVPDRLVEWSIGLNEGEPFGHVYGWVLEPTTATETIVTNYCDWSELDESLRPYIEFPVVPVTMLEQSVANLRQLMS